MATDVTSALARLLSDPSLRSAFARDPAGVARELDVDCRHRGTLLSLQPEQLEAQAQALLLKRLHGITALLPRTIDRLGDHAKTLFLDHARAFWPSGHRRQQEDALAFGRFVRSRHPPCLDLAEFNRLLFETHPRRWIRIHVAGVHTPFPARRRAVQVLYRGRGGNVRSLLVHFGLR